MYTHNVYTCAHTSIHSLVRFHVSFHGFILMLDCLKQYKHLSTGLSDLGCLPTKGKQSKHKNNNVPQCPKKVKKMQWAMDKSENLYLSCV